MVRLFNWILQVAAITRFGLMSLPRRKGAVAATILGVAGVVAVLVGLFHRGWFSPGSGHVGFLGRCHRLAQRSGQRNGQRPESSGNARDRRCARHRPFSARPLASAELWVILDLPKRSTGTDANVPMRGVERNGLEVRKGVRIIEGRMFELGKNEVIVGCGAASSFAGLEVGKTLKVAHNQWLITGVFSAQGGISESEIWTDAHVLQEAYRRGDTFQSVYARLNSPGDFQAFKDALTSNPQLSVKVERQSDFYAGQSETMTRLITTLGVLIASLMAIGAVFGALNTMYGAVAARTREIATLRALGFGSAAILVSTHDGVARSGAGRRGGRRGGRPAGLQQSSSLDHEFSEL